MTPNVPLSCRHTRRGPGWVRPWSWASRPSGPAALVLLLAAAVVAGCGPTPTPIVVTAVAEASVAAAHEPMHPDASQAVTFQAEASGTVDRVELAYVRFSLSAGPGGTHQQTLAEAKTVVDTCDPPGTVSTLPCTYTMSTAFPADSLVAFYATAYDGAGLATTETYSFAAGDYPWPDEAIPIRASGPTADHLDIVLIPDTDMGLADFRAALASVVGDLYFKYSAIKDQRTLYNFYYSGVQGDYEEKCNFTNPSNMADLLVVADTVAILHQNDLRDCRAGTVMSSEVDYDKTLMHESGHALFDLADEYCCDSSYAQQACVPNLWSSLAACQADAPNVGHPDTNCTQLSNGTTTLNFWYIDPAGADGCMMGDAQHKSGSDFGKACQRRIEWRYGKCLAGDCFPWPACP